MKIMIVEDDIAIRDEVAEALRRWGFETVVVQQFDAVLTSYIQENPHLVLMDINLPAFDGFYWCRQIREVSKVPILFLSSRNTPMDMVMSMNMGGDDFIQKPFYTDVLVAKINALLRRTYSYMETASSVIAHNGVVLNLKDGDMACGDQKSELTRNEFKILSILLQNQGAIVSREQMMRGLWEDESFVDDNTLTVNITRLRKKLAELGRDDFIVTKKGQGYLIP
ncbi:response regulator transcription factor [Paenibacillus roseipurpureus]|uniref:Response regulator transcription factor n=1 Tax=Paenibacillus roseopurpureus TaxID=2918901 RepID=A0AA96RI97_9BACL|nr:response regulator transcription factor [Paenibacillus sp. MBLB1832]WNR44118.1 response regulator transcription factor [Paenibacillus sp. MBLB1832]